MVAGTVTTRTLSRVAGTLLDKRGGYLSNDKLPPGMLMDNVPNWEFGVLVQVRDLSKALRLIPQIEAGTVWVNMHTFLDPALPFGGVKASGRAREGGVWGLEEFMDSKQISGWDPEA